jgi:ABC-type branched-subunit amino acid transport system permease subunit
VRLMLIGLLLVLFMRFRPEGVWKEEKPRPA